MSNCRSGTNITGVCVTKANNNEVSGRDRMGTSGGATADLLAHLAEEREEPVAFNVAAREQAAVGRGNDGWSA
jgi:hypothetical protein